MNARIHDDFPLNDNRFIDRPPLSLCLLLLFGGNEEDLAVEQLQIDGYQCRPEKDSYWSHCQSSQKAELLRGGLGLRFLFCFLDDELVVADDDLLLLFLDGEDVLHGLLLLHGLLDFFLGLPPLLNCPVLRPRGIFVR